MVFGNNSFPYHKDEFTNLLHVSLYLISEIIANLRIWFVNKVFIDSNKDKYVSTTMGMFNTEYYYNWHYIPPPNWLNYRRNLHIIQTSLSFVLHKDLQEWQRIIPGQYCPLYYRMCVTHHHCGNPHYASQSDVQ